MVLIERQPMQGIMDPVEDLSQTTQIVADARVGVTMDTTVRTAQTEAAKMNSMIVSTGEDENAREDPGQEEDDGAEEERGGRAERAAVPPWMWIITALQSQILLNTPQKKALTKFRSKTPLKEARLRSTTHLELKVGRKTLIARVMTIWIKKKRERMTLMKKNPTRNLVVTKKAAGKKIGFLGAIMEIRKVRKTSRKMPVLMIKKTKVPV
mmetsp:Transcript_27339/g.62761  ORF Transcript_27339/g.62761 Transcript_27339/m.62761 type:complete len:210 (-) Transcript_27339:589-1218(-)